MESIDMKLAKKELGKSFNDLSEDSGEKVEDIVLMISGQKKPSDKLLVALGLKEKKKKSAPKKQEVIEDDGEETSGEGA